MTAEPSPVLDTLFEPQKFDVREVAHAVAPSQENCRAENRARRVTRAALPPALLSRSRPVVVFRETNPWLSPAEENGRPVRNNPKDSMLEKSRGRQAVAQLDVS